MRDPVFLIVPALAWILLCLVVGKIAASFHRPPGTWILLALLFSPLVAFVFLLIAGDTEQALALAQKEEEIRRKHPERQDIREAALNEMNCPHCGAAINPVTEDGLHSPAGKPWLLICNQCQTAVEPDG
jgi:hypothetical protein